MPKAGMPDLFLEIMQRTGFAKAFTHLSERQARVEHFETSLCAALIAEACNIGVEPVSRQDVPALRRERLTWVGQNFIRPETIAAANARIVSAHATLPTALSVWLRWLQSGLIRVSRTIRQREPVRRFLWVGVSTRSVQSARGP